MGVQIVGFLPGVATRIKEEKAKAKAMMWTLAQDLLRGDRAKLGAEVYEVVGLAPRGGQVVVTFERGIGPSRKVVKKVLPRGQRMELHSKR